MSDEPVDTGTMIEATIVLRRPQSAVDAGATREELERSTSADPADLAVVRRFLEAYGLHIERENAAERSILVSGTVEQMQTAFAMSFHQLGNQISSQGEPVLPSALKEVAVAVLGLDKRPIAKPHY